MSRGSAAEDSALQTSKSSLNYMPGLDVMRGLAISMVLLYHGLAPHADVYQAAGLVWLQHILEYGAKGVHLFFILSGFLITGILLKSKDTPDYYRNFYLRRILRIVPAYLLMVVVLRATGAIDWKYVAICLLYLCNMSGIFGSPPEYGPLWSLSVEEQFYLVWPFAVRRLSVQGVRFLSLCILLGTPLLRLGLQYGPAALHDISYKTWAVADFFAAGSLLAIEVRKEGAHSRLARVVPILLITGAVLFVLLNAISPHDNSALQHIVRALEPDAWLLFFSGLMLLAYLKPGMAVAIAAKPLVFLANISYGLYLCHQFFFNLIERHWPLHQNLAGGMFAGLLIRFIVEAGISIMIAWLSRRTLEEFFLRKKPKHGRIASANRKIT